MWQANAPLRLIMANFPPTLIERIVDACEEGLDVLVDPYAAYALILAIIVDNYFNQVIDVTEGVNDLVDPISGLTYDALVVQKYLPNNSSLPKEGMEWKISSVF